jgi:hypothetical protein
MCRALPVPQGRAHAGRLSLGCRRGGPTLDERSEDVSPSVPSGAAGDVRGRMSEGISGKRPAPRTAPPRQPRTSHHVHEGNRQPVGEYRHTGCDQQQRDAPLVWWSGSRGIFIGPHRAKLTAQVWTTDVMMKAKGGLGVLLNGQIPEGDDPNRSPLLHTTTRHARWPVNWRACTEGRSPSNRRPAADSSSRCP